MLGKITTFWKGKVIVQIKGYEIIRILNLCCQRNIRLFDIKKEKDILEISMTVNDYKSLQDILKKTKAHACVKEKYGMPFFMPALRIKMIFWLFMFGIFLFIFCLSNYIWHIEINGNTTLTKEVIYDFLNANDISIGTKISKIDTGELEMDFRNKYPIVTWVCFSMRGTELSVSIKENQKIEKQHNSEQEKMCDLVSDKDGKIVFMVTRNGIPMKKVGEEVKVGDILVSGKVPIENDDGNMISYREYRADATVIVKTKESYKQEIDHFYYIKKYTGREQKMYDLIVGNNVIHLPRLKVKYKTCEKYATFNQLCVFDHFYFPFFSSERIEKEYQLVQKMYSSKEAESILQQKFENFMLSFRQKGVPIIQKNVRIKSNSTTSVINGYIVVCEQVGIHAIHKDSSDHKGVVN